MMQYHDDILKAARTNTNFRKVLATTANAQLVVMSLKAGEDIGEEVHTLDQYLVFVEGRGVAVLNGEKSEVMAGHCVVVPAGTMHNFINNGSIPVKLYTVYAPAQHRDGTVHVTKAEAEADELDHPEGT